jgi:heavy metal sensor kinase
MTHLSIRWRLTLWYGASIAAMLGVFSCLLYLLMHRQAIARIDAGLAEEVKEIRLEIELAKNIEEFAAAAQARFSQHALYDFLITDHLQHVVFASPDVAAHESLVRASKSSPSGQSTQEIEDLGKYRITRTKLQTSFGELTICVLSSLVPLHDDLKTLQWIMAGLSPAGVVFAIAVGQFLTGRMLKPVQQVVDVANAIDISRLDQRIHVSNPHDEIGKLAIALNSLIMRLEQAVTEIRRFTADASHEIRTPIATLRAEAEAALRSARSPEEHVRVLEVIVDEAAKLSRLTDQLLQLSRYDAGIAFSARDAVQLDALIHDVVDQLQPFASNRGVTLTCNAEASAEVSGDDVRLSQALFNVIENGIKYSRPGGQVNVRLYVDETDVVIDVVDRGVGIAPGDTSRIFDRFYRCDPSRQSDGGGTGLGLSIAKTAITYHQGTIAVCSTLGVGSTFTIRLPACCSGTEGKRPSRQHDAASSIAL